LDTSTIERIEDALREIAVLFIALSPLDVKLGEHRANAVRHGLIFVTGGHPNLCSLCTWRGGAPVDDFLIVMGAVMFVCLAAAAWAFSSLRRRDSKPNP
jgi:hypothetical protein